MVLTLAEITTGTLILSLALATASIVGSILIKNSVKGQKNSSTSKEFDNSLATFASRNTPIPLIIGRRRTGPTVLSVWNRVLNEEVVDTVDVGGGGGLFGKGGSRTQNVTELVYRENAIHAVCIGPVTRLRAIYKAGEAVWTGDVGPDSQDRAVIDLGAEGTVTFYFGSEDSPVSAIHRQTATGVPFFVNRARWLSRAEWTAARLGASPVWPQIEYEVECFHSTLLLSGGTDYAVVPTESPDTDIDKSVNFGHILWMLLTAPSPHGAGLTVDEVDKTSLELVASICEDEELGGNVLVQDEPLTSVIEDILSMIGFNMVEIGGVLAFVPVRPVAANDIIELTDDVLSPPLSEISANYSETSPTRYITSFPNIRLNYRTDGGLSLDNDSIDGPFRQVELTTRVVTSQFVMNKILRRKVNELYGDAQVLRISSARGSNLILPGAVVDVPDVGTCRVISVRYEGHRGTTELEVIVDSFGPESNGELDDFIDGGSGAALAVEPDDLFNWLEVPDEENPDTNIRFVVFRARAHGQILGSNIHISIDSGPYFKIGNQNSSSAGAVLESGILDSAGDLDGYIADGPIVAPLTNDIERVVDLTLDEPGWRNGRQLCLINSEVFYLRNILIQSETEVLRSTAYSLGDSVVPPSAQATGLRYVCTTAGTTASSIPPVWPTSTDQGNTLTDGTVVWTARPRRYQLKNLLRARFGTIEETHATDDVCMIIEKFRLAGLTDAALTPGQTLCLKSLPFTQSESVSPASVTEVCAELTGSSAGTTLVFNDGDFCELSPSMDVLLLR